MSTDQKRLSWRALARLDSLANRLYGSRYNPLYQSGAIVIALIAVLLITGLYLLLLYRLGQPWASVARMTGQPWGGRWVRGLHRFASDAAVVAAAVHAFRMYAQRRDWGPRALAWVSGLVLLGLILVCGWTGYVMVWDTHAQLLAAEGARLLDALPIFSEPIGRAFVGERAVPTGFFFLNLFAHVALPIGLGLLIWIHVSRVARPVLLPPRSLSVALIGGIVALAVIWPVGMAPEADLLRIPYRVPLDWFFAFWLPLTQPIPAGLVWIGGVILAGVLLSLPLWARPRAAARPGKSVVNERHCTGCEQCMLDCPYGAIAMVSRTDGREGIMARVNPDLCVGCGICIGSCAPMALGPAGQTGRDQLASVRAASEANKPGPRDVVVIGCAWSAARRLDIAGVSSFPVACAGNLHSSTVEYLIRSGTGGVLIVTCPARDCRGREGTKWLHERLFNGREAELKERVDRRRIRVIEAGAASEAAVRNAVADLRRDLARLAIANGSEEIDLTALCERSGVSEVA